MLSRTAEYALRAVLYLARESRGRPVTADTIASALGAPANYMAKTLNALARADIVAGTRGPQGGFVLRRDPAALTVAELVGTFDEPHERTKCLLGGRACTALDPCGAHQRWTAVLAAAREPMTATTVADLLDDVVVLSEAV